MTMHKKVLYILLSLGGIVLLPYLGSWIHHAGKFPPEFFEYPPIVAGEKAPFNKVIFGILAVVFIGTAALYLFPRLFGFRKP